MWGGQPATTWPTAPLLTLSYLQSPHSDSPVGVFPPNFGLVPVRETRTVAVVYCLASLPRRTACRTVG